MGSFKRFTKIDLNKDEVFDFLNKTYNGRYQIHNIQNTILQIAIDDIKVDFVKYNQNYVNTIKRSLVYFDDITSSNWSSVKLLKDELSAENINRNIDKKRFRGAGRHFPAFTNPEFFATIVDKDTPRREPVGAPRFIDRRPCLNLY
jgi:hypothetical protein